MPKPPGPSTYPLVQLIDCNVWVNAWRDRQAVIHGNGRRVLLMALFFSFSIGAHFTYVKTFKGLAYRRGGREFSLLLKVSRKGQTAYTQLVYSFSRSARQGGRVHIYATGQSVCLFPLSRIFQHIPVGPIHWQRQHSGHCVLFPYCLVYSLLLLFFASWTAAIVCCLD